jgi:hypothetical protein
MRRLSTVPLDRLRGREPHALAAHQADQADQADPAVGGILAGAAGTLACSPRNSVIAGHRESVHFGENTNG